jgi:uncharacterized protein
MDFPRSLRDPLSAYAAELRRLFGERLRDVRLFGSYARGDANDDSDIDVLVLVDGLTDLEIGVAAGAVAKIILESKLPLAPLPMSTERFDELRRRERRLAREIDLEGISL